MKKLLLITLLIVGCEEPAQHGCLDSQATNYDVSATIDNNSCTYIDSCGVADIDITNDCVKDCADVWGGDAEQKECLFGTWIKVEEGVGITYILTFKEDNTFETEFIGGFLDSNPESYGSYSITETQISIYGEGGSAMCESNPGVYNFEIDYNKLTFILINDDCEARSVAIEGVWYRYNN